MAGILIPYRGVIEIVADHDIGKTIAALQTAYPYKNTVFIDDDVKGDGTVRQMAESDVTFGKYINLGERRMELGDTPSPTELLEKIVIPTIDEIVELAGKKKHDVIIWDTWRIVYSSARGHVERNQELYKDVVNFRGTSTIIQGLISKVARMIEQTQMNKLRQVCELLIITHHLKDNYQNNVVVGKIPESSQTLSEVCNMRLWLRRNVNSKVPVILFLKRPNFPKVIKGQMRFVNIVPMKIIPTNKHESIWDAISDYEKNPIESRKPTKEEEPTPEEMALINRTLTDEQKRYMFEIIKLQKETEEALQDVIPVEPVKDIPQNGIKALAMAKSWGYELDQIKSILGDDFLKSYKSEDWKKMEKHHKDKQ